MGMKQSPRGKAAITESFPIPDGRLFCFRTTGMDAVTAKSSVKSVCPFCGVGCGIVMDVVGNRVVKVRGDKDHPANFGRLCTKGNSCGQAIADAGRLDRAHLRSSRSEEQVPVSIDEAISQTALRLRGIIEGHGPDAVAFYVSGQMSIEAQYLVNKLAKGYVRTKHVESNSRLCMASAGSGYKLSLGSDGPPGSYEDFDKADLFFVIGANMADCHPILFLRMMDRVKRGAKLIVVDPRRTATAEKADLFLQIKAGTDLALLNGLLHLLVKAGKVDAAFISDFTEGWDQMPAFLDDYDPARVASLTGLSEDHILLAAEMIGDAPEWMSCWTMGLNQSTHGTWNTNALCNLHLATGKICRTGSGPFSLTGQPNAMGGREMGYMGPGLPGQRSALATADRAFVEDLWSLPEGTLRAEGGKGAIGMFEDMRAGDIKACWIICTNPVASVGNRQTVIDALKTADLVITQDAYLDTETNIYADIMLPGALWAEGDGVMVNSERNMTLARKAVDAPGDALPDWLIIARVACEMGYGEAFSYGSAAEVFEEITRAFNPQTGYDIRGASHERLGKTPLQWPIAAKNGDDRNPIRYLNPEGGEGEPTIRFATASGKAVFLPRPHMDPAEMPDAAFPFVLNTGRVQHQWHTLTKTGKVPALNKLNPGPFAEINPEDALRLGVQPGDRIEIRSRRGKALLPANITDRVLPGNCFAPFHWNDIFGDDLAVNAVTNDAVDPVSLQPELKVSAVALTRVAGQIHEKERPEASPEPAYGRLPAFSGPADDAGGGLTLLQRTLKTSLPLAPDERLYLDGFLAGLSQASMPEDGIVPVLPASAPFGRDGRLLVDGMLAGFYSRTRGGGASLEVLPASAKSHAMTVLWASQTGNAEDLASRLFKQLCANGFRARLMAMDAFRVADLVQEEQVLFVTSTFGDGDPPDNAVALWAALEAGDVPRLCGLSYSVLALGDSNYDQFCGFGRKLDARLEALGATRLADRAECEPDGDETAERWRERVQPVLRNSPAGAGGSNPAAAGPVAEATAEKIGRKNPRAARLVLNRLLSAPGSGKETRQFAFDIKGSGMTYEAGDALGVWPRNCPALVGEIIGGLRLSPDAPVKVEGPDVTALSDALERCFDITRITPEFLRWFGERSHDPVVTGLVLTADRSKINEWTWSRQIADVIAMAPFEADAEDFVSVLKRLQPRLYSISSSPKADPGEVHLTVSTVRYDCGTRRRNGVSSAFLADRAGGLDQGVPIFVQPSAHFRPPRDPDVPMIMIGPGTGVAPFRAFLQERALTGAKGRNWLFFGEQHAATDFYYRDELEDWAQTGHLTRLDAAFSRDQADKIYVQHRLCENGAEVWRWLEEGAHVYVCGDAQRMAKDVDAALRSIIALNGGMEDEAAGEYLAGLASARRYVRDVY